MGKRKSSARGRKGDQVVRAGMPRDPYAEIHRLRKALDAADALIDGNDLALYAPQGGMRVQTVPNGEDIVRDEKRLSDFVRLHAEPFEFLYGAARSYELRNKRRLYWEDESRSKDGGTRSRVDIRAALVMTLAHVRNGTTKRTLADVFGVDQSTVRRIVRHFLWVLGKVLPLGNMWLDEIKKLSEKELAKLIKDKTLIIDGTVTQSNRPMDPDRRAITYTGRKKMHGNNTLIVGTLTGIILDVSWSVGASMVDIKLLEKYLPRLRRNFPSLFDPNMPADKRYTILLDKGFVGAEKFFPGANVKIPKKRSKYHELTKKEDESNGRINKKRIRVEHEIGRIKSNRAVSGRFRGTPGEFNVVMRVAAGLENLCTMWAMGLAYRR